MIRAVGYKKFGEIEDNVLQDIVIDSPEPDNKDLLVKVEAVSVNPIDTKLRRRSSPKNSQWRVLGFDASGTVEAVGKNVSNFKPGDEVFYAGDVSRQGTNSELHLVDERIVGRKPEKLTFAESAALPLTSITAWEMLFDRLDVNKPTAKGGDIILVIGGAGGVGSIAIQLLRALTGLTIIATASRPETIKWVQECGAHYVIDHKKSLAAQIKNLGIGPPGFVFSTNQSKNHFSNIVDLIAPQGRFGLIDDITDVNIMPLKEKSVSIHWELMFTRPLFETPDLSEQANLLNKVAELADSGKIQSTLTENAGKITAENLTEVHERIEKNMIRGKIVLEGF